MLYWAAAHAWGRQLGRPLSATVSSITRRSLGIPRSPCHYLTHPFSFAFDHEPNHRADPTYMPKEQWPITCPVTFKERDTSRASWLWVMKMFPAASNNWCTALFFFPLFFFFFLRGRTISFSSAPYFYSSHQPFASYEGLQVIAAMISRAKPLNKSDWMI